MHQHAETNSPPVDASSLTELISNLGATLCRRRRDAKDVKDKLDMEGLGSVGLARNIAEIDADYRLVKKVAAKLRAAGEIVPGSLVDEVPVDSIGGGRQDREGKPGQYIEQPAKGYR